MTAFTQAPKVLPNRTESAKRFLFVVAIFYALCHGEKRLLLTFLPAFYVLYWLQAHGRDRPTFDRFHRFLGNRVASSPECGRGGGGQFGQPRDRPGC